MSRDLPTDEDRRVAPAGAALAPRYVVWELTLACDLACRHCGSRAGKERAAELSLAEGLRVLDQLAEAGTREITFIGGEAYLHPEWLGFVRGAVERGIRAALTTGGRGVSELAEQAASAGLSAVSVSIDGLRDTHDTLRAVRGSFDRALEAVEAVRAAGMASYANTQINRLNLGELDELFALLMGAGVQAWQVQLTGPMGRAADRPDWLLQPYELLELVPRLAGFARAAAERGRMVHAANNLGYFGPHEQDLRLQHWAGCAAGKQVLGIESNGDVKGCPSLPSAPYVGGNLRTARLSEIWARAELAFARDRPLDELWGHCEGCYYAAVCRGGCSWTSHTLLGRRGNMPYCFHRADMLRAEGRRERLVQVEAAPGEPFDFGRYELVEEPWPPEPERGSDR